MKLSIGHGIISLQLKRKAGFSMKTVNISVPEYVYTFYQQVGQQAGGIPPEQVMADSLFKLAGELSLNAIHTKEGRLPPV